MIDELAFLDEGGPFIPSQAAESASDGDFKPIPAGSYPVRIIEATLKDNNAGNGKYVKFRYDVIGDNYKGRVIWDQITIQHQGSEKAESIGLAKFAQLCLAAGFADRRPNHLKELIGKAFTATVVIGKPREYQGKTYDAQNEVKRYAALEGAAPVNDFDDDDIPF